jgi:general stress protein 26
MSNNGDVSYDGTSYYFTYEQARAVADIRRNPKVALGLSSEGGIFSDGIYLAVEGTAELIRDKAAFQQHWTSDLDHWFENGVNTPGIVLIKVKASRATYWKGREEGEVELCARCRRIAPRVPSASRYTALKACSISAIRSSGCSMPIESRIVESRILIFCRISAGTPE